jgi:hypothetical protein
VRKVQVLTWDMFGFLILALYESSLRLLALFDYVVAILLLIRGRRLLAVYTSLVYTILVRSAS